ncbi:MAG: nuclear transport factor 2 family protein [Acidobacteria bacterium]|nr:nuclear transport factor 2 family protein [Acidobacteriota bacterium]
MNNVETVKNIYDAFGRGDVAAILEKLSPDVRWEVWKDNRAQKAGVPWMQSRSGREGAAEFFKTLATHLEFKNIEVPCIMEGSNKVVAEFVVEAVVRTSGARVGDEELHLWTFGEDGKVSHFRHYTDTAKHIEAAGL